MIDRTHDIARPKEGHQAPGQHDRDRQSDRLHFALDVGRTGIWSWDPGSEEFLGDRGLSVLWGLPPDEAMSVTLFKTATHGDDVARAFDELRRAAEPGGADRFELEFRIRRRNDGAERWIALQGRRYANAPGAGTSGELIGMARDVTSRKQREGHMHLLMREVTHRSKNLLAIIQAMARQTVKDSITASEFERRFSMRLRGLAASHDLLAARDWHGAAIGDLVRWQLGPALEGAGSRIEIQGPDVYLNPEAAQNIGLAINELASNASRFGALSNPHGRIVISWFLNAVDAPSRRFRISWTETGGPPVEAPRRFGFGHKVVERLAARALDGEVSLAFAPTGVNWTLDIPASFILDAKDAPIVN